MRGTYRLCHGTPGIVSRSAHLSLCTVRANRHHAPGRAAWDLCGSGRSTAEGRRVRRFYCVVRQGLRTPVESCSIKKLEPLYAFTRTTPIRDANTALQTFEAVLTLGDGQEATKELLETIEGYNRDDCVSAVRLRLARGARWLPESATASSRTGRE